MRARAIERARLRAVFNNGTFYREAPVPLERRIRAAVRDVRRTEYGRGFAVGYLGRAEAAAAAVLLIAIIVRGVCLSGRR